MNTPTPARTTQTATTPDGTVHALLVSVGRTRCPATAPLTRTGRKQVTDLTCAACGAACPAPAARPVRPVRRPAAVPVLRDLERVQDVTGACGVVIGRHSRTQVLVSYDDGREVVMYRASLRITQN